MVLDWCVHLIDQLLDLLPSKVIFVYAKLQSLFTETIDDSGNAWGIYRQKRRPDGEIERAMENLYGDQEKVKLV